MKIATIDTMLSFFLAFLYADRPYYNEFSDRIVCMSKFLFEVQQRNRLEQKGLLRRFSITCYGHQESVEEMRSHKAHVYQELKAKKGTKEFDEWFLNYKPVKTTEKKAPQEKAPQDKNEKKKKKKRRIKTKKAKGFWGGLTRKKRG